LDFSATTTGLVWTLTGANTASVGGTAYSNVGRIVGGAGDDTFVFAPDVTSFAGALDGGAGDNTLDYTDYAGAALFNLATGQATGTTGVANIQHFVDATDAGAAAVNVAPAITDLRLEDASIDENGVATLDGAFTDGNLLDTHTAS